jgi:hypothetical protein
MPFHASFFRFDFLGKLIESFYLLTWGKKAPEKQKYFPGAFHIGTFWKLLLTTSSRRFGIRVSKAINLERLIQKGRNRQAPPKGIHEPFGGFT